MLLAMQGPSLLPAHILRLLIITESYKLRVTQVMDIRPFDKFELSHEDRLEPPTIGHLRGRQPGTPAPGFFFGQIRERAFRDLQRLEFPEQRLARRRRESVARPRGVDQLAAVVITDYQRIEVPGTRRIASDNE